MARGTPQQRDDVARLHKAGKSRNGIARELGISAGTVTAIAQELGLSFDRSSTKAATAAKKADLASRRADLEALLLDDAHRLRAQIWQPHTYVDHGGRDFVKVTWEQSEPSPVDKLKLMQAAGIAIDRSLKIAAMETGADEDHAKAMLVGLFEKLGQAWRAGEDPGVG